jgi:hypothetical protein
MTEETTGGMKGGVTEETIGEMTEEMIGGIGEMIDETIEEMIAGMTGGMLGETTRMIGETKEITKETEKEEKRVFLKVSSLPFPSPLSSLPFPFLPFPLISFPNLMKLGNIQMYHLRLTMQLQKAQHPPILNSLLRRKRSFYGVTRKLNQRYTR